MTDSTDNRASKRSPQKKANMTRSAKEGARAK
jgi:hypothetical protein